jgi:hypothetical protein
LAVLPFLATSQDKVCISQPAAIYYLEVADKYYVLQVKDTMQEALIDGLREESRVRGSIIITLENDSNIKDKMIETKTEEITFKDVEIKSLKKEIRRQKVIKVVTWIGTVIIIVILI